MSNSNRTKLLLDITTFTAFLIVMNPRSSGIAIHEWLAASLGAAAMVHLLLNWNWIVEITKRLFTAQSLNGSRWNYILNWLLFADGILVMLSGLMISQSVIPSLGINLPTSFAWRGVHEFSTNLSMILLGVHVAMHWNWIMATVKRLFVRNNTDAVAPKIVMERKDARA